MTDHATVDYVADIKVGDRVWVMTDRHRNNKTWTLQTVTKIARVYFTTTTDYEYVDGFEFRRDGGGGRGENGYSSGRSACGEMEKFLSEHRYSITRQVEHLRDLPKLIQIAKILGLPTPVSVKKEEA